MTHLKGVIYMGKNIKKEYLQLAHLLAYCVPAVHSL